MTGEHTAGDGPGEIRARMPQERRSASRTTSGSAPLASLAGRGVRRESRAQTEDLALALAFLDTIADPRAPWVDRFPAWAAVKELSAERARAVRVAVLRIRSFGVPNKSDRAERTPRSAEKRGTAEARKRETAQLDAPMAREGALTPWSVAKAAG